jgi:hexose kinase, 1-phosphofructokinase family
MIVTVTPNPAVDLTYHVDAFLPGETLRVDGAASRAGGKGVNVARVARQMGERVVVLATAGGATGSEFADDLTASGLDHRLTAVAGPTRRTVAIVDRASGATTIMNERGATLAAAECDAFASTVRDALAQARCLVVSGSLPPGAPDTFCAELVRHAHRAGVPTVIDAVGPALVAAARAGADVIKPNRAELFETTGITDPVAGARTLLEHGAGVALVSLGGEGMLAVTRARALHARLPQPLHGNPTGAGDAAVAAAAVGLSRGDDDLRSLLVRATAWSAAAVLRPVAGEIADDVTELERLIDVVDA